MNTNLFNRLFWFLTLSFLFLEFQPCWRLLNLSDIKFFVDFRPSLTWILTSVTVWLFRHWMLTFSCIILNADIWHWLTIPTLNNQLVLQTTDHVWLFWHWNDDLVWRLLTLSEFSDIECWPCLKTSYLSRLFWHWMPTLFWRLLTLSDSTDIESWPCLEEIVWPPLRYWMLFFFSQAYNLIWHCMLSLSCKFITSSWN